jgi:putative transcription factor
VQCELCGREADTRRVAIEGTVMSACADCARFGKPMEGGPGARPAVAPNVAEGLARRERRMGGRRDVFASEGMGLELVADFGRRIQAARERKGWTRQQLGAKIREPENVVTQFEQGSLHPPDYAARRIERELGITLFEKESAVAPRGTGGGARGLTLGDVLKKAERDQGE